MCSSSIFLVRKKSRMVSLDRVRSHAKTLFETVGVSMVVVVDDEYADRVERLIGICSVLPNDDASDLPHLDAVDFNAPPEISSGQIRDAWEGLDSRERHALLAAARALEQPSEDVVTGGVPINLHDADGLAATSLEGVLGSIGGCKFERLSLAEWEGRRDTFLDPDAALNTLFLFDLDYRDERAGTEEEGFKLVQEVQERGAGYCGVLAHTVRLHQEYETWKRWAGEKNLDRGRFVVVSKDRLKPEAPDYYGFLAMLRVAALGERYAQVKSEAWSIVKESLKEVKLAVDSMTVMDFDRMVFTSSRREGVWEPDTLFRVFGVLVRREASIRLHRSANVAEVVRKARKLSDSPKEIADALEDQGEPSVALQMQRYEVYDAGEDLNAWRIPIGLGDVFQVEPDGNHYLLLAQPCDLMVRSGGVRAHEDAQLGRTVALVEIVQGSGSKGAIEGKLPFYEKDSGQAAYARYAKVHQVRTAVLDLCVYRSDGLAAVNVSEDCPDDLVETWRKRHGKLQRHFRDAINVHRKLTEAEIGPESALLAIPDASTTLKVRRSVRDGTVEYGLRRIMRLREPWSAAILTEFAHHQARAAFEHYFGEQAAAAINDADPGSGPSIGG